MAEGAAAQQAHSAALSAELQAAIARAWLLTEALKSVQTANKATAAYTAPAAAAPAAAAATVELVAAEQAAEEVAPPPPPAAAAAGGQLERRSSLIGRLFGLRG
jgi:hypothetical protein